MDSVNDPSREVTVVMSSAQVGKTEILNNIVCYYISQDPCPVLLMQPTLEMAEAWSKDRLAPMLRDTKILRNLVKDARTRDSGNTVRHKVFPGGHITMAGANSPASLASRPVRVLLADEVDRYPSSAGTEGDPVSLGKKRTTTFWNRKLVMTSTPTVKGVSRIERAFQESTQEHYHVPCPECGATQRLVWGQVKWDKNALGQCDLDSVRYECEHCGEQWTDNERWEAIQHGEWIADDPKAEARGFHLNELYSSWVQLRETVAAFHEARKNPETLKTWVNTALGETWEEGDTVDHSTLFSSRRSSYPVLPERALIITAGVDVQKDRLEYEIVAWSRNMESWSLRYERIYGDPLRKQVWNDLDDALAEDFEHETGMRLRVSGACVDTGGHHTQEVYAYCKPRWTRRVFAIKGRGGMGLPVVASSSRNNRNKLRLFTLGVDTIKSILYGRLQVAAPGPGYCHFPIDRDEQYFFALTSERAVPRYTHGHPSIMWVKDAGVPNEPLDCRCYATAAVEILRPPWSQLEKRLALAEDAPRTEENRETSASGPARPTKPSPGGKNWVTEW